MAVGAALIMISAVIAVGYIRETSGGVSGDGVQTLNEGVAEGPGDLDPSIATSEDDPSAACHCDGGEQGEGPDVAVDKTAQAERSEDGSILVARFTMTVASIGGTTATNVRLVDHLPDLGGTWELFGPDADDCAIDANGTLTCAFGDLHPGATRTVGAETLDCDFDCGPDIVNEATVSADEDTHPGNNKHQAIIEVDDCPVADVAVHKSGKLELEQGDHMHGKVSFTITVTSVGEATATRVTLHDELPDLNGAEWVLSGPNAADCTLTNGLVLDCSFGSMAPGSQRTVTVTSTRCDFECDDRVQNTVVIDAENDANAGNNEDTAVIVLPSCPQEAGPDVEVVKTGSISDGPNDNDDRIVYDLVVRNIGGAAAHNVRLTDTLPEHHDFVWRLEGADADDCTLQGRQLTCAFGTLQPGESRSVRVRTLACDFQCDETIVNEAVVTADHDTDTSNNRDRVVLETGPCGGPESEEADVGVDKSGTLTNHERTLGSITYTVVVTNHGPGTALNVRSTDVLPNLNSVQWRLGGDNAAACGLTGRTVHCTWGDLQPGETRRYTVSATRADVGCTGFSSTVDVVSDNDLNAGNNRDTVTLSPDLCPDVSVQKDGGVTREGGFDVITWTITVRSVGNGWAHDTVLTDPLPFVGADWQLGGPDAGDCTMDGDTVRCAFGVLAPGESRTITVRSDLCVIDEAVTNTAFANTEGDIRDANNRDSATVRP